MTLDRLRRQSKLVLEIASAHGATNVRVTGSVARDEADDASDVDLIVHMEPERNVRDISELILDLQDALGCRVDVFRPPSSRSSATNSAMPGLLRDAVSLGAEGADPVARRGVASRDRRHVESINESLLRIAEYTAAGRDLFLDEWMAFDAVVQRLTVIAGSVQRLSNELKIRHPAVMWRAIMGFPLVAAHSRGDAWQIVDEHLSDLRGAVDRELREISGGSWG